MYLELWKRQLALLKFKFHSCHSCFSTECD